MTPPRGGLQVEGSLDGSEVGLLGSSPTGDAVRAEEWVWQYLSSWDLVL